LAYKLFKIEAEVQARCTQCTGHPGHSFFWWRGRFGGENWLIVKRRLRAGTGVGHVRHRPRIRLTIRQRPAIDLLPEQKHEPSAVPGPPSVIAAQADSTA
jgi:hypothetical protein